MPCECVWRMEAVLTSSQNVVFIFIVFFFAVVVVIIIVISTCGNKIEIATSSLTLRRQWLSHSHKCLGKWQQKSPKSSILSVCWPVLSGFVETNQVIMHSAGEENGEEHLFEGWRRG